MNFGTTILVCLIVCVETGITQDEIREFVDDTGNHKTRATLVKIYDDKVELQLENGEIRTVPFVRLSKADVAYIIGQALEKKVPLSPTGSKDQVDRYITNSIGMKLALIQKGTFKMGSPPDEKDSQEDERQHDVTISKNYHLGVFEVTQAQYEQVMGKNPSRFQGDEVAERHPQTGRVVKDVDSSNHPVEHVSWLDAVEFCKRLSGLPEEKKARRVYRLPTEAEWEYACRAGSKMAYSFSEDRSSLGDYAFFRHNTNKQTQPVGEKMPNVWGLYDMHGNVWEWCSDWYGDYPKAAVIDPVGPSEGSARVFRGGGWDCDAAMCRAASRRFGSPMFRGANYGFRVALGTAGMDVPQELPKPEKRSPAIR